MKHPVVYLPLGWLCSHTRNKCKAIQFTVIKLINVDHCALLAAISISQSPSTAWNTIFLSQSQLQKMSLIRNILSERELRESLDLLNILSNHTALVPNQQTCQKYKWVLDNLNAVGRYWIYTEALNIGMTKDQANIVGGQILPFGSYALNVFESGNGLDAILLAPNFVTAEMFSQNFLSVLQGTPTVTMCVELLQESVPKITFVMDDVEIDLVFVSLMSAIVPDDLRQFDSRSLLYQNEYTNSGLDGIRLTDAILTNLPQESYFQITLRLVKLWAKSEYSKNYDSILIWIHYLYRQWNLLVFNGLPGQCIVGHSGLQNMPASSECRTSKFAGAIFHNFRHLEMAAIGGNRTQAICWSPSHTWSRDPIWRVQR